MERISASEFWQWAYGDFLSNAQRGVLAEFIVAKALGCTQRGRVEWDAYDLETDDGIKVEVKSAAYLQSWAQKGHSIIRFNVAQRRAWDAKTNILGDQVLRSADVYVFCVFAATEKDVADPLDLTQWFFLVCRTSLLDEKLGAQKSVRLATLEALGLGRVDYANLGERVRGLGR